MRKFMNLVVALMVATTVSGVAFQTPASAVIAYGADVKRSITIQRAQDWYDRNIPYDQGAYSWDENRGRTYRQDCSGFIAMVWKMNGGNPNGSAGIWTGNLDDYSHRVNWNDLLPGDALLLEGTHVQLFHAWVDPDTKADFWIYEEGSTATDMNHRKVNVIAERQAGYVPMRYDHIIAG
jgi:hypothetical protein